MGGIAIQRIVLNEIDMAHKLLNGDVHYDDPYEAVKLIARYDRQIMEYNQADTASHIKTFVEEHYPDTPVCARIWKSLDAYAEHGGQYRLNDMEYVPMYQEELGAVMRLPNCTVQCFAFAFLAVSKYESLRSKNKDGWISGDRWGEIAQRADVTLGKDEKYLAVHELIENGFIQLGDGVMNISAKPLVRMNDGTPVIQLTTPDYEDLGYCYRQYLGENFTRCLECGRWVKQPRTGRPHKYCNVCSAISRRKYKTEKARIYRGFPNM